MALYRMDYQLRVPWTFNPSGYYYWTNVFYFDASTPMDFDLARDEVIDCVHYTHNPIVEQNRFTIRDWPSGTLVQNTNAHNVACDGQVATPLPIMNTMLVWLTTDSGRRGFKRFRVPLGEGQVDGVLLTSAFVSTWVHGSGNIWASANHQCLADGTPITGSMVDPYVRVWQWRHGTKRRERIALV